MLTTFDLFTLLMASSLQASALSDFDEGISVLQEVSKLLYLDCVSEIPASVVKRVSRELLTSGPGKQLTDITGSACLLPSIDVGLTVAERTGYLITWLPQSLRVSKT